MSGGQRSRDCGASRRGSSGQSVARHFQEVEQLSCVPYSRDFLQNRHSFLNGKMSVSGFHFPWKSQMFVPSTMVLDFLARSEAIEAAVFSLSTTGLYVAGLTKHEMNSAGRSIQWTKM